jgi:hypothetical protein
VTFRRARLPPGYPQSEASGRRASAVDVGAVDGPATGAQSSRPSVAAGAVPGRQHRLLAWSALDVVLRVRRRHVRPGSPRGAVCSMGQRGCDKPVGERRVWAPRSLWCGCQDDVAEFLAARSTSRSTWSHSSSFLAVVGTKVITRRLAVS